MRDESLLEDGGGEIRMLKTGNLDARNLGAGRNMRFSIPVMAVALGLVLVLWACGGDADGTATPLPAVTATAASAGGQRLEFAGTGPWLSPEFELVQGTASFNMEHDGVGTLLVAVLDADGARLKLVSNAYSSDTPTVLIPQAGTYALKITADGNWTVTLEQ